MKQLFYLVYLILVWFLAGCSSTPHRNYSTHECTVGHNSGCRCNRDGSISYCGGAY